MKIPINSKLYEFKRNWIDFNAGALFKGKSMETVLNGFIGFTVGVCNSEHLKHEETGFKEIVIFKTGVTL